MKNLNLFFLLVLLFGLSTCQINEKLCEECNTVEPHEVIQTKVGRTNIEFNVWHSIKDNYSLMMVNTLTSKTEMREVLEFYKLLDNQNDKSAKLVDLIIYTDQVLFNGSSLAMNKIKGLLLYYRVNEELITAVYKLDGTDLLPISELTVKTTMISTDAIHLCAELFKTNSDDKITSMLFISAINSAPKQSLNGKDFKLAIRDYLTRHISATKTNSKIGAAVPAYDCDFPCNFPQNNANCVQDPYGVYTCTSGPDCGAKVAKQVVSDANRSFMVNLNDLYDFRNNFLQNSNTGKQYIKDYYSISTVIKRKVNLNLAIQGMNLANNKVIPITKVLLNNPNSNSILYTDETRNQLIDFINELKKLSGDSDFQSTLKRIENDVNLYVNIPVRDVVGFFD